MPFSDDPTLQAPCSPERLVELVREGNLSTLEELSHCFGERLVSAARRACGNEHDADDAVQDALLSAGEHLTSFRGEGSLEGWLVRMVVHACRRMQRGRKNNPRLHSTEVELTAENDPEELSSRSEMAERVGSALLTLSAHDRAVVLLAEADGWTGPEIGDALGMSPAAVRNRLMRARKKVREILVSSGT